MDFWARLKDAIKAQNTTQEWVAGKIGVSISTFRKWIHRKTYPDLKEGVEIAKLLEVSAEFLVTGIDHEGLNEEEIKLISAYRKLTPPERENAVLALVAWAGRRRRWLYSQ